MLLAVPETDFNSMCAAGKVTYQTFEHILSGKVRDYKESVSFAYKRFCLASKNNVDACHIGTADPVLEERGLRQYPLSFLLPYAADPGRQVSGVTLFALDFAP